MFKQNQTKNNRKTFLFPSFFGWQTYGLCVCRWRLRFLRKGTSVQNYLIASLFFSENTRFPRKSNASFPVFVSWFFCICALNLVPMVFSLSNMAAVGERTLAHSRNHVTDLSTESGNLFKMAAKIKSERIWVQGLETGEKQTKWRQRQTRKKLKIRKNSLTSHRNTVEWYSDLIFCSMTFICFKPERSSVHGT